MTIRTNPKSRSNSELQRFYQDAYAQGEESVFTYFENGKMTSEYIEAVREILANYSENAILQAKNRLGNLDTRIELHAHDFLTIQVDQKYDVITCLGTLEHMDRPTEVLKIIHRVLKSTGIALVAVPHFINLRGIV